MADGKHLQLTPRKSFTDIDIATARERVAIREAELRDEGFKDGLSHAHHAERPKLVASACVGAVLGAIVMAFIANGLSENATFTAGAVVDRVLSRTINAPEPRLSPLAVRPLPQHACRPNEHPVRPGMPCPGPAD